MIKHWAGYLAFVFIVAIAFESTCPPSLPNDVIPHLDKIAHFFAFGLLAWLVVLAIFHQRDRNGAYAFAIITSFLFTSLLTIANEWLQSFNPSRVVSLDDMLAGMAGAAFFMLIWYITSQQKKA